MTFSMSVQETEDTKPPICVFYGGAGVGKTTLAAGAEDTLWMQTEDGAGELKLKTVRAAEDKRGPIKSFEEFDFILDQLLLKEGKYKTLVIDSLDHLEPLVDAYICGDAHKTVGDLPYGTGYQQQATLWKSLLDKIVQLRDDYGKTIIMLAHETVTRAEDLSTDPYDVHDLKLGKKAKPLAKESCDILGMMKKPVVIDQKTGRAKGGTETTLFTTANAAWNAKTRWSAMPARIPIPKKNGWDKVAQYIPALNKQS